MEEGEIPLPFFVNGFAGIVSRFEKNLDRHQDKNGERSSTYQQKRD
jgi:hypothetical protein